MSAREWMKDTGEGLEGRHPLTGQYFRCIPSADDETIAVWLDGRLLRSFPNDEAQTWVDFINALIESEYGREDEEEALKTPVEHASSIASAVEKTRGREPPERVVTTLLDYHDSNEIAALLLPLVMKDEKCVATIRKWLADRAHR